jgi:hypothetical protein
MRWDVLVEMCSSRRPEMVARRSESAELVRAAHQRGITKRAIAHKFAIRL